MASPSLYMPTYLNHHLCTSSQRSKQETKTTGNPRARRDKFESFMLTTVESLFESRKGLQDDVLVHFHHKPICQHLVDDVVRFVKL